MPARLVQSSILLMLGAAAALADDKPVTAFDLVQKGAVEIATGRLLEEYVVTCWPMPRLRDSGCTAPRAVQGEFKRLKLDDAEFVCISFRRWACTEAR